MPSGRFIPTPVGNTTFGICGSGYLPVHPHACGEHRIIPRGGSIGPGSSPRLWGTHRVPQGYRGELRFIPTPVGNTNGLAYFIHHEPVHPHACGEHSFRLIVNTLKAGSSPRLWGTPLGNDAGNVQLRFIPTPVGNTPELRNLARTYKVHPHACGEHLVYVVDDAAVGGSSPRLWGTRDRHGCKIPRRWFIPTPVGNTVYRSSTYYLPPVHPHACGEHTSTTYSIDRPPGSSPRLWGTRRPDEDSEKPDRFIPTPVGNTKTR